MSYERNVIELTRNTVGKSLADIPADFLKLAFTREEVERRRVWFRTAGDIPWKEAACNGQNPSWWFPERGQNDILDLALSICSRCPIKAECLAFALCTGEDEGIWGGTTGRQRRTNRRKLLKHLADLREEA